jgi:hypothetical protein
MWWLTSATEVLIEALLDPPPYADDEGRAPLEKRHLDFHFLHETRCVITDELLPPALLKMLQQHQSLRTSDSCAPCGSRATDAARLGVLSVAI